MKDAQVEKARFVEAMFWDGYCRACEHIIEMEEQ